MRRVAVQDVFDASPNPYMVLDRELRFVMANRAYLAITGSKLSDLIGKRIFDAFPNDADAASSEPRRLIETSLRKVLATRQRDVITHIPYRVQREPGGEPVLRVWTATHTPVLDEHGEVELILQHTEDVTALYENEDEDASVAGLRRHAEQMRRAVLERDQQLRKLLTMFDLAPGFFAFLRGPELVFELVNRAFVQLVGERELVGLSARDALPEVGPENIDTLARAFATGKPIVGRGLRLDLAQRSGGELHETFIDFVIQPLLDDDGASLGVFIQGQDVTEQRRADLRQEFLTRASEKVTAGIDDIEEALAQVAWAAVPTIADWAFVDVFTNGASRRLVVAHADGELGDAARELERSPLPVTMPPGHPLHDLLDTPRVLAKLSRSEAAQLVGSQDGLAERICFHSAIGLPLWHRERLYGVFTFATAQSHRTYDDADLPMMVELSRVIAGAIDNARLAREREEALVRELEARQRAEAANRAKDDFLAILGHELRNPLAPILTAVQLMRLRGESATQREQAIIERQAHHMVRLVDDLLDVSRIAHGKIELRRTTVELSIVAAKALEIASPLIDERGHHLQVSIPRRGLRVDGDEARLAQVIANLLTNSARYTPPGGRIWLDATREGDEVVIRVRDNGIGMEPDMLDRVFDMFRQAPRRSSQTASGGLGLGLTLVQKLTELHGGHVTASSPGAGQGSEFVVRLPALAASTLGDADGAAEPGRALTLCRRVLLVDDNEDAAELLGELVRRRGHEVMIAHDGEEGLSKILEHRPDVAVVDIGLPGIDGYQVATRVREALGDRAPILIALTGYGAENDRVRSRRAGFVAHLTKPVDSASLLELLSSPRIAS